MKIVRLEQGKIKVFLCEEDLKNMKIDADSLSPASPELGRFLCEVMEAVKIRTGFSADESQTLVEATQVDGGIVLLLSKPNAEKSGIVQQAKKCETVVFEFLTFDNLLGMIKNVAPLYLLNMKLYTYRSKFYIAVPRRRIPILIYEYSFHNRKSPVAESVIAEYGTLLAGGYRLMGMATGLKKLN